MTTKETLKKYFGYDSFRGGQEELTSSILSGKDVLGIMPTGAGKSICFQLPAIMLEGITLVVSPLISLMQDQVRALIQSGIPAAYINSSLTYRQVEAALYNAKNGKYKLIYVAPERLLTPDFLTFARSVKISMLTVDEAHCISQWGQDFRPSYAEIPEFINQLEERPIVSAFTATATKRVREDILSLLKLQNPTVLVTGFNRENLYFEVQEPSNKMQALFDFLHENRDKSGIVYCFTRKTVEEVCEEINHQGHSALRYHAGLGDRERHQNQEDFLFDKVQIMVATNAFGMGIDKSNVGFVVHYNMPKDIESYYQEAGRAGRDGSEATCLMLYSGKDVVMNKWLIENAKDTLSVDEETATKLKERDYRRLRDMTFYARTTDCLRGYILRYFGESPKPHCGNCSNCGTKFETIDITKESQKILSCIARTGERFGAGVIIDVLKGSQSKRIKELEFDKLSTYNISQEDVHTLHSMIEFLVQQDYLHRDDGQYAILSFSSKSQNVLKGKVSLEMKLPKEVKSKVKENAKTRKSGTAILPPDREELFNSLKILRKQIADVQGVPPFVIFYDKALIEMCVQLPESEKQFLDISGVGDAKLAKYGERFLQIIKEYKKEKSIKTEPIMSKSVGQKSRKDNLKSLILPSEDVLKKIEIVEKPSQITFIAQAINLVMAEHECSTVSPIKISEWLMSQGYLKISEQEGKRTKIPSEKGLRFGISQEKREREKAKYSVNLYPSSMQEFIIEHICDILEFQTREKSKK
ncbi:DNA helicase RecQ [Scatolibacter rhodanostii]|uniref:DNA helicase RecQ n=1 Tax=Scatolibacter rhodanostii TaxID=2014781 RepID=UPI000C07558C|nr:DNA helicase RecQ [Scatolibacter rhodanostii]